GVTHSPVPTKDSRSRCGGGSDATNSRVARVHFGHPRHGRWHVPVLCPSLSRPADLFACHRSARSPRFPELQVPLLRGSVHHPVPRLLGHTFRPLHLYSESG